MHIDPLIRQKIMNQVLSHIEGQNEPDDDTLRRMILLAVANEFTGSQLTFQERQSVATGLYHTMRGLDILQPMMDDPDITEIMVNGPSHIYFERHGKLILTDLHFESSGQLIGVITNFYGRANRLINENSPLADMRLPDGSRVHAALPPAAPDGPVLTIRKFTGLKPDMVSMVKSGFVTQTAADYLVNAVKDRKSIFICGGTDTGKTTFLNVLAEHIPESERIVTIEDTAELSLQGMHNLVRLEARLPGPDGRGEINLSDLIRASLRMRPDRIIVGEVRSKEAFDMLQAMNTGHPGSLCTGHGNSCQDMLDRLSLMILMSIQLPWDAIQGLIASALDIVVHLYRNLSGQRQVDEIGLVRKRGGIGYALQTIYRRENDGVLRHILQESSDWIYTEV